MDRLTHERNNGIKTGYWSPEKKDVLIERLAAYEDTGLTPEEITELKEFYRNPLNTAVPVLEQGQRWIPVVERLPEKGGEYLVTFAIDEKVRLVGYGCCRKDILGNNIGFGWYDLYSGTYFSDKAFVSWMPLPEPYRGNEEN